MKSDMTYKQTINKPALLPIMHHLNKIQVHTM